MAGGEPDAPPSLGNQQHVAGDTAFTNNANAGAQAGHVVGQNTFVGQIHNTITLAAEVVDRMNQNASKLNPYESQVRDCRKRIREVTATIEQTSSIFNQISQFLKTVPSKKENISKAVEKFQIQVTDCQQMFRSYSAKVAKFDSATDDPTDFQYELDLMVNEVTFRKEELYMSLLCFQMSIEFEKAESVPKETSANILSLKNSVEEGKMRFQRMRYCGPENTPIHNPEFNAPNPYASHGNATQHDRSFGAGMHESGLHHHDSSTPHVPNNSYQNSHRRRRRPPGGRIQRPNADAPFNSTRTIPPPPYPEPNPLPGTTRTDETGHPYIPGIGAESFPNPHPSHIVNPFARNNQPQPNHTSADQILPSSNQDESLGDVGMLSLTPTYVCWSMRTPDTVTNSTKGSWKYYNTELIHVSSEQLYQELLKRKRNRDSKVLQRYNRIESRRQRRAIDGLLAEQNLVLRSYDARLTWAMAGLQFEKEKRGPFIWRKPLTIGMTIVLKTEVMPPHGPSCPCVLCRSSRSFFQNSRYKDSNVSQQRRGQRQAVPVFQGQHFHRPSRRASLQPQAGANADEHHPIYVQPANTVPPPPPPRGPPPPLTTPQHAHGHPARAAAGPFSPQRVHTTNQLLNSLSAEKGKSRRKSRQKQDPPSQNSSSSSSLGPKSTNSGRKKNSPEPNNVHIHIHTSGKDRKYPRPSVSSALVPSSDSDTSSFSRGQTRPRPGRARDVSPRAHLAAKNAAKNRMRSHIHVGERQRRRRPGPLYDDADDEFDEHEEEEDSDEKGEEEQDDIDEILYGKNYRAHYPYPGPEYVVWPSRHHRRNQEHEVDDYIRGIRRTNSHREHTNNLSRPVDISLQRQNYTDDIEDTIARLYPHLDSGRRDRHSDEWANNYQIPNFVSQPWSTQELPVRVTPRPGWASPRLASLDLQIPPSMATPRPLYAPHQLLDGYNASGMQRSLGASNTRPQVSRQGSRTPYSPPRVQVPRRTSLANHVRHQSSLQRPTHVPAPPPPPNYPDTPDMNHRSVINVPSTEHRRAYPQHPTVYIPPPPPPHPPIPEIPSPTDSAPSYPSPTSRMNSKHTKKTSPNAPNHVDHTSTPPHNHYPPRIPSQTSIAAQHGSSSRSSSPVPSPPRVRRPNRRNSIYEQAPPPIIRRQTYDERSPPPNRTQTYYERPPPIRRQTYHVRPPPPTRRHSHYSPSPPRPPRPPPPPPRRHTHYPDAQPPIRRHSHHTPQAPILHKPHPPPPPHHLRSHTTPPTFPPYSEQGPSQPHVPRPQRPSSSILPRPSMMSPPPSLDPTQMTEQQKTATLSALFAEFRPEKENEAEGGGGAGGGEGEP